MPKILLLVVCLAVIFCGYKYFTQPSVVTLKGENWSAKKIGSRYVLSIKNHAEIVGAVTDFLQKQNIQAGTISGIGAVNEATLRFFNPQTKQYDDKTFAEQMEISNLTGNIAVKDGKTVVHIHITLGTSDYSARAGHLLSARLNGAGELVIDTFPHAVLEKAHDEETGLNFYKF